MKIAICGYKGKTGKEVYNVLKENKYNVIGVEKNENTLKDIIAKIDLVIDFTVKENALKNIYLCLDFHKPFIIGTTGFTSDELAKIKSLCKMEKVKGVICYNFSLPINYLLNSFSFFNSYFEEIDYLDIHHVSKIDKTSGTTYLFMLKNKKVKVKSYKVNSTTITYVITLQNKYEKMTISYQVYSKKVYALGLLYYLKNKDKSNFINLIAQKTQI